jgi:parvulin-like peptidyl-prolyl isomerase
VIDRFRFRTATANSAAFSQPSPRRLGRAFAAVAVSAAALTSCSATGGFALKIDKTTISKAELEDSMIAREAINTDKSNPSAKSLKTANGGWEPDAVASSLNRFVLEQAVHDEFASKKLTSAKQSTEQLKNFYGQFGPSGEAVFKAFPKRFQDRQLRFDGEIQALLDAAPIVNACAKHILVEKKEEADAIRKRIVGGEDFGAIAKVSSKDPGSGANGGDLGCADPSGYVPEFKKAVETTKLNELTQPVKTQFGYHLIIVTKRSSNGKTASAEARNQYLNSTLGPAIVKRLPKYKIAVDSAFGKVQNGSDGPQIVPVGAPDQVTSVPPVPVSTKKK